MKNSKYGLQSVYMYEKIKEEERENLYKYKFSGESKGGQNNKVLEKLAILIWTHVRFFVAGGTLWIM